jgi:predicted Zn-dependent peptidase
LPARAQRIFLNLIYGDQPAGWDVAGTKETVTKLNRADVSAYRDKRYVMPGTIVVVAGKFNEKKTIAQIKSIFGHLKRKRAGAKVPTKEKQSSARATVHFKESDQAHLVLGFRAFPTFDKRRYALRLMADVLGSGMSSRLFMKVREELGAAYYIGAGTDLSFDHGFLSISAGVDHKKLETVIRAVLEECRRMRDEIVPAGELQKSKDHMIGNLILGLETSDELASFYGSQELIRKELLPPELLIDRIRKTTAREVQEVARTVFRERGLNLALVGPYKNTAPFKKLLKLD